MTTSSSLRHLAALGCGAGGLLCFANQHPKSTTQSFRSSGIAFCESPLTDGAISPAILEQIERFPTVFPPLSPPIQPDMAGVAHMSRKSIDRVIASNAKSTQSTDDTTPLRTVHSNQYNANQPCEDTFAVRQLKGQKGGGTLFGVYDGHSGGAASAFCAAELFDFILWLDARKNQSNSGSVLGTGRAFTLADSAFLDLARREQRWQDGMSGACAIVAHLNHSTVSVASAGDCRCIIGQKVPSSTIKSASGRKSRNCTGSSGHEWMALQLTQDHAIIDNPSERNRLLEAHPNEYNIIRRDRVKGRLQPTRGLGDGKYKRMVSHMVSEVISSSFK